MTAPNAETSAVERSRWAFLTERRGRSPLPRIIGRVALGGFLLAAGTGHLGPLREEFQAQVPPWVPLDPDFVVIASGIVEVSLGAALIAMNRYRVIVGWTAAAFFVAIFPGNISQWMNGVDAFGLESDQARFIRLFFQPVLVAWALWSTEAWKAWRESSRAR
ncbi:MAG: DoxX family protein [Actinomycetota bacterium]